MENEYMPDFKVKMLEVIAFVTSKHKIKTSELQIKFLWGYNRASRVIDTLENLGIISPFTGLTSRKVLMNKGKANEYFLKTLTNC